MASLKGQGNTAIFKIKGTGKSHSNGYGLIPTGYTAQAVTGTGAAQADSGRSYTASYCQIGSYGSNVVGLI